MSRIKELDSIRAIAILLVMLHHAPLGKVSWFLSIFPMGASTFFVLSGFLITGILLKEKKRSVLATTGNRAHIFKNFILKRALRIFPLYFLVVAALFFIDSSGDQSRFLYYGTFTSNFYIHEAQYWPLPGSIWSISVQEQFYLFWPWVILFVPNRYLLHAIALFIIAGVVSHFYLDKSEFGNILTIACLDSLGIGALLAWSVQRFPDRLPKVQSAFGVAALIIAVLYLAGVFLSMPVIPQRTLVSILVAVIICGLVCKNALGKKPSVVLSNRFLLFVGKISFGLYLFHQVIPFFTFPVIDRFLQNNLSSLQSFRFILLSLITSGLVVLAAWLSWKYIESPFLNLKKYIGPKPVQQELPAVTVAVAPVQKIEAVEKE